MSYGSHRSIIGDLIIGFAEIGLAFTVITYLMIKTIIVWMIQLINYCRRV